MKGRPEQSFLDQFSERFMNHVRQVCTALHSLHKSEGMCSADFKPIFFYRCVPLPNQFLASNVFTMMIKSVFSNLASLKCC